MPQMAVVTPVRGARRFATGAGLFLALLLAGCGSAPSPQAITSALTGPCSPPVGYTNPVWSPDPGTAGSGSQIAFEAYSSGVAGANEINVMNAHGGARKNLTPGAAGYHLGGWSPDGSRIVFMAAQKVMVMAADGSNPTALAGGVGINPSWSPDGRRIVFSAWAGLGQEISVVGADGSGFTQLTHDQRIDNVPAWSPDGRRIAFAASQPNNAASEIAVIDADGGHQTLLTHNTAVDTFPEWSPDGQRIVFQSNRDGVQAVYLMDSDGKNQTRLTTEGANDYTPVWSPDGQRIAFVSNRDGNQEIYVMAADGSAQTRLTDAPRDDNNPVWSPDPGTAGSGSRIAFVSWRDGNSDIWVMAADGSGQTQLTVNPAKQQCLKWPF